MVRPVDRWREWLRECVPGRRALLTALGAIALFLLLPFACIDRSIVGRFEKRTTSLPSRVYASPLMIRDGGRLDTTALSDQLGRLSYQEVLGDPTEPGQFRRDGNDWTIHLRSTMTPDGPREALVAKISVGWRRVRRIADAQTTEQLDEIYFEPERLVTFYADVMEERRWTPLDQVPVELHQAVEAVEDKRFRRHHGVDLIGIARALTANLRAGGVVQGGSTITQQLAKNLYGPGERTLRRKLVETVAAVALELHYDKGEILEAYLNEVYLGQLGPVAISGIGDASRFFFGADVRDIDLARAALLAGMIRNPGRFNPRREPAEARERRDLVLQLMHEQGAIDERRLGEALAAPIEVAGASLVAGRLPWIEDYLAGAIDALSGKAVPSRAGYSIFTTFDPRIQQAARESLDEGLQRLERRLGSREGDPLEGAVVVMRPGDGALLALVGGRDHGRSQYNRAVQARRSPGSTFKPFVFLAGLERARQEADFDFTPATVFEDESFEIRAGGKLWSPQNYDRRFRGAVSVRDALEQSINVPTVRAALEVGLDQVVDAAHRCGIDSELDAIPALALGAQEVTPLELATAYATLANGGWLVRPHGVTALLDRNGVRREPGTPPPVRVIEPELAFLVTDMLEGVVTRGTARSAARLGFSGPAAGKTGSSDGLRDAWFVGYTSELLALVWVGYDDNRPIGLPGGAAALPIWTDLMQRIGADGADPFERPEGLVQARIDPTTGQRATRRCPDSRRELFLRGTEPEQGCSVHGGSRKKRRGLFKRWFGGDG